MARITGTIQQQFADEKTATRGPRAGQKFTVHTAKLDTGDRVDLGFKNPGNLVGKMFDADCQEKFGKWKPSSGDLSTWVSGTASAAPIAATPASSPASGPATSRRFPVPFDTKDTAIMRQNALTNAVNLHSSTLKAGQAITPELREQIIESAYHFVKFSSGHRELEELKKMKEEVTVTAVPADDAPFTEDELDAALFEEPEVEEVA